MAPNGDTRKLATTHGKHNQNRRNLGITELWFDIHENRRKHVATRQRTVLPTHTRTGSLRTRRNAPPSNRNVPTGKHKGRD